MFSTTAVYKPIGRTGAPSRFAPPAFLVWASSSTLAVQWSFAYGFTALEEQTVVMVPSSPQPMAQHKLA